MQVSFRSFAAITFLCLVATALGQASDSNRVIAVNVESSDPQILQILPRLREDASRVVENSARNVRAIIVIGSSSTPAEEEARRNSADYLLTINLSIRPSVEIPPSGGLGRVPYGIAHARCVDLLGSFTFSYTVLSLTGKNITLHDSHIMQREEYPLGPELDCVDKLSTRAVRNYASAAVHKLKSKKML